MEKQSNTEKAITSKTTEQHSFVTKRGRTKKIEEQKGTKKGGTFSFKHSPNMLSCPHTFSAPNTYSQYEPHRVTSYIANHKIIRIVRVCLIVKRRSVVGTQFDSRYTNRLRLAPSSMRFVFPIPSDPVVDVRSGDIGAMPQCALRHIEPRRILHNDPGTGKVDDDKAVRLSILLFVARHDSLGFVPVIDVNGRSPGTELEVIDSNATLIRQHHAQRVAVRHAVCFNAEIDDVVRSRVHIKMAPDKSVQQQFGVFAADWKRDGH